MPAHILAQPEDSLSQAKQLYKEAREAYSDKRYLEAITLLKRAYELDPDPTILFNIARAYQNAGLYDDAKEYYDQVLLNSTDEELLKRTKDASEDLEKFRKLEKENPKQDLVQLKIETEPPGAAVVLNGVERGETPFSEELPPESYNLGIVMDGYFSHQQELTLAPGTVIDFSLDLIPEVEGNEVPVNYEPTIYVDGNLFTKPAPNPKIGYFEFGAYLSWGVGVLGIIGGVVFYGITKSDYDDMMEMKDPDRHEKLKESGKRNRILSVVFYSVGFVGLVAGTTLYILHLFKEPEQSDHLEVGLVPQIQVGPTGFALEWVF